MSLILAQSRQASLARMATQGCLLLCLWLASGGVTPAGDWPQWLGPSRNGVSSEVIKPWSDSPEILWRQPVGNGFSTPVLADAKLFVHAEVPEKDSEELIAIDADSGEIAWRKAYDRGPYKSTLGAGPRATPVVDEGRLFSYGITGTLTCFDALTGQRQWQANPFTELNASLPAFGVCSSPVVVRGKVIVPVGGPGSAVVAYDASTGEIAWKQLDEPAAAASPVILQFGDGPEARVDVVTQTTLRIVGLNPDDGTIRWEHPLVFQPSGVSPTPLVIGDLLVCTTQDTGTLALQVAENASGPKTLWWEHGWSGYFSTGAVGDQGRVYLVTNMTMPLPRADVRCLNAVSGKELWHKEGLGYFHVGVIVTGDGKLLLLDDAGNLTLADPAESFKALSRSKVCRGTFVNPVLSDGKLYARDDAKVVCVQLPQ